MRDLEFKAKGRHQRKDRDDREMRAGSGGNRYEPGSNQSGSHQRWDRSRSWESRRNKDHSHSRESCRQKDYSHS